MRRKLVRNAVAVAIAASVLVTACTGDDDAAESTTAPADTTAPSTDEAPATTAAPATTPETTAPAGPFDPYAQDLEWTECDGLECAEVTVPIDYDDPAAGTTTIAMQRQPAAGEKIGTLFINPGGPGGSGVEFLFGFSIQVSTDITDAYDIVGFDPRGVGQSDPLGCLDDEGLDTLLATDVDPDDQASIDAYSALVEGQGEACLTTNPELAQHVTTVETAKDFDVLRALVGDEQLNYYGASYGTFLGTTYAALFPERVGRLVLDGAVDPSLTATQSALRQTGGVQLAFGDYAADCVATGCPVGGSVEEIEAQVTALLAAAADEPLPTADPDRSLTQALAFYGLVEPLYDEQLWPILTEGLVAAADGDGTPLLASADLYNQRSEDGYASNLQQAFNAISCIDAQIAPEPDFVPTEDDFLEASPLFGAIAYGYTEVGCEPWPIAPTVEAPDYTAAGAAPILVVGTTGDPATPFESARKLADLLESGVLLVRDGEGHTAYFSGNQCITDTIDAYLLDGTVPDDGTVCGEDGTVVTDDADTTSTTISPATSTTVSPATTVAPEGPDAGAEGSATFTAGDISFDAVIVECTLAEPDVSFVAEGENAGFQVTAIGGGDVDVVVEGVVEWEGRGTATITGGDISIVGTGGAPDDSAPVEDFSIDAQIDAC